MGSFWDRFGRLLGSKIVPKILLRLTLDGLDFDLAIDWSQDGPKTVPRGLLGGSWGGLGPLFGALGPSLEGLRGLLGRLEGVLGCSWGLLGGP